MMEFPLQGPGGSSEATPNPGVISQLPRRPNYKIMRENLNKSLTDGEYIAATYSEVEVETHRRRDEK